MGRLGLLACLVVVLWWTYRQGKTDGWHEATELYVGALGRRVSLQRIALETRQEGDWRYEV